MKTLSLALCLSFLSTTIGVQQAQAQAWEYISSYGAILTVAVTAYAASSHKTDEEMVQLASDGGAFLAQPEINPSPALQDYIDSTRQLLTEKGIKEKISDKKIVKSLLKELKK